MRKKIIPKTAWGKNAQRIKEEGYDTIINRLERYYICPECQEPIYDEDFSDDELMVFLCPVCEWNGG